ncbi:MAG: hypothetical protein A2W90_00440 [Bacteroidetes bacterium GWF2_42_66]|nr:MAG: hypothetical protein A2W89_11630 [Bacteroidetes bacterium GWE2_42_39]OFY43438.1 MAG: hypothetical protein A2W90_00440 [Bacteroidetes bacterium GWF2_42_66]HBL76523.1 hypothetical protein [Prolixibacteraceae bacterium]HCR92261.1 hypothetical protein [Prolixibacteraceae bacterium]HCU63818.1 hypothetical protein [Prolixibacteraceae bacterium]
MKTFSLVLLLCAITSLVNAQDIRYKTTRTSKYSPELSEELHKISILPLGYAYERKIAEEFTIEAGVDFSFDIYYAETDDLDQNALVVNPTIHLEPRYYYNLERRYQRGRNVSFNAASYLGVYSELRMNPLIEENNGFWPVYDRFKIGPAWGIQRNLGRRGYLNFNLAYGLVIDETGHARYDGFGRLTLGIRLNGVVEK